MGATKCCIQCKQEKPLLEFYRQAASKDGHHPYCKVCSAQMSSAYNQNNRERMRLAKNAWAAANRDVTRRYNQNSYRRMAAIVEDSKTPCLLCGEARSACVDFHHRDPTTKTAAIGQLVHHSKDALVREIEKCVCLCANCHRLLHAGDPEIVNAYESKWVVK